jgi:peptidoglycan L-alanyl-D-glutamate endopeptidase CwlK
MITLAAARKISLEKIGTLNPIFAARAFKWYDAMTKAGHNPYIYCGLRSEAEQNELYKIGRDLPGRKVTNARGGQSFHNYGRAFDWVPLTANAKNPQMFEANWSNNLVYQQGQIEGTKFYFRWLSWETPHLEDANFKDWKDLQAFSKKKN